jgi:hypothetical protein
VTVEATKNSAAKMAGIASLLPFLKVVSFI